MIELESKVKTLNQELTSLKSAFAQKEQEIGKRDTRENQLVQQAESYLHKILLSDNARMLDLKKFKDIEEKQTEKYIALEQEYRKVSSKF